MNDKLFTKDSMFVELKDVYNYLRKSDLKTQENLPAMIILERQLNGINKHGIAGRPQEIVALFDWGISQYARENDISFDDLIAVIEEYHKTDKKIIIQSEKYKE